jgi:hypothetical protein
MGHGGHDETLAVFLGVSLGMSLALAQAKAKPLVR